MITAHSRTFCPVCGRPISAGATMCRQCSPRVHNSLLSAETIERLVATGYASDGRGRRITDADRATIRRLRGQVGAQVLASFFGVSISTVSRIQAETR